MRGNVRQACGQAVSRFRLTSPKPPTVREKAVVEACLDLLRYRGYFPVRLHTGLFKTPDGARWISGTPKGTPDYMAVHEKYPGLLLETKRPGGDPSPAQQEKQWELRFAYRLAVVTIDGVEALSRWLDEHEKRAAERWKK